MLLAAHRVAMPLRRPDVRLLWYGQSISSLGDYLQTVAITWLVLDLTGSPLALGGALLAIALPKTLCSLLGGTVTDRTDPRVVMIWSDGIRAVVVALLAILTMIHVLDIWFLYLLLIAHGCAGGYFQPAVYSIIPRLVPSNERQSANSLIQLTSQIAMLIGAPVAGILVTTFGTELSLILNSLSFIIAAALTFRIARVRITRLEDVSMSFVRDIVDSFRYVRENTWLATLLSADAVLSLAIIGPLAVGLPLFVHKQLNGDPQTFGLLLGSLGAGSIIGTILLALSGSIRHRGFLFCLLLLIQGPVIAGIGLSSLPLAFILLIGVGSLNAAALIIYLAIIQDNVAEGMLGRVMGLASFTSVGLVSISQIATGALAAAVGTTGVFAAAGGLLVLSGTAALLMLPLRRMN